MSGRKATAIWLCIVVIFAAVTLSGGSSIGAEAAAVNAEFQVTNASLEQSEVVEGDTATITADIENVGTETGTFTAELRSDADGVINTTDVEIRPDETRTVDFRHPFENTGTYELNVNGTDAGELTVTEPPSAEFDVTAVTLSESEITVGETVTVTAEIANIGDADDTYTAELQRNGTARESKSVDVAAGETATVSFTPSFETAGDYAIGIGDGPTQTLTADQPQPANVSVTDAELSETRLDPGESVTVTATVENDGGTAGEITADLQVDGTTRTSEMRTVDPSEQTTIEFTPSFAEAGTYGIAVNDESAGTLTVSEPAAFEVSNASLGDDTILAGGTAVVSAEVTNVGDTEGTFNLEFRATNQDGTTETVDTRSVMLGGGESQTVELRGAIDEPGEYDVQINQTAAGTLMIESPANLAVTDAELEGDVVDAGEEVTVSATIENTGDREGTLSVSAAAGGDVKTTEAVTVGPGETRTQQLTYTATAAGEYEITVNGMTAETLTVIRPATFRTTNPDIESDTVLESEPTEVTATIVNVGTESGTHTATLVVDGESVATQALDIGPGDSETVVFSRAFDEADEYAIAVNNDTAGTLSVLEPANVSIRETTLSSETITAGESVTVTVVLTNDGDVDGELTTQLRDGNATLGTDIRTVGPDANETVRFNRTFETSGDYDLAVNNDGVGTLAVLEPADVSLGETTVSSDSVEVNESVEFMIDLRNDGEATGQRDVDIALGDGTVIQRSSAVPENGTTLTVTHAYNATGEYTVAVDEMTVANVTVDDPEPTSGSGGGGGGGGGGSSGASGSSGSTTTGGADPTVVRSESEEAVSVSVVGGSGEPYDIAVDLAGPSASQSAVAVSSVGIDPTGEPTVYETTIGQPTAEPSDRNPAPYGVALGYLEFNASLDAASTSAATLQFTVDEGAIPSGLSQENVSVYRYADSEWTMANVTHDVDGDTHTVTLPHAMPVAVVALDPGRVEIVESVVPAEQVRAGYETTLRTTVVNPGDSPATRALTVSMDGEPVTEREVTLDPGENATVRIEFEPSESGSVSLEGTEVGDVTLFGVDDGNTTTADPETNENVPGFGVGAAVLALLVTALGVRSRRS
ncbi:CARDB domain-containing protein [Halorubrum sp. Hd13]|uniref:CARDB domain-containing protein n=1 Tax=Halorubrum sp. Hd13 TaxID=1480728 RepID=UPI000B985970|nr:CARDB domain-containing protein [Halorubrum sp. Hd13]OYR42841.1 APHP domain-containing protein [Halorubrum sp. Hd13]